MHVEDSLLFVADSAGTIRRFVIAFNNKKGDSAQLSRRHVIKLMTRNHNYVNLTSVNQVSVDWLNRLLYIVSGDGKIHRCDFNGEKFQTLIEGFEAEKLGGPFNLQVDPINGYLFYSLKGERKGGIYRIGLSEFRDQVVKTTNSRGKKRNIVDFGTPKHYESVVRLIVEKDVPVFTIDYLDGKILYPRTTATGAIEMIATSVDGKHSSVIRKESQIQSSKFGSFKKITFIEGLFQWINGELIFLEEKHSFTVGNTPVKEYVHNSYSLPTQNGPITSIVCFTEKLQPYPIPRLPVQEISAIFGADTARVSWKRPPVSPEQDSSAWQGWEYELSIRPSNSTDRDHITNGIKEPTTLIAQLSPDTDYLIKVRAYLGEKKAPWSQEYRGKTKPPASSSRHIYGPPTAPKLTIESTRGFIEWTRAEANGGDIVYYQLFLFDSDLDPASEDNWVKVYNGTNTFWYMNNIAEGRFYRVKVRALNEYGESPFSAESQIFQYLRNTEPSTSLPPPPRNQEYLIAVFGFLALFFVALVAVTCVLSSKKKKDDTSCLDDHKKDLNELVSLPELPHHPHRTNVLYMPGFSVADELAMIPHVRAEQIEKTKQLGEGAFGCVYEGYVHRLWGPNSGKTKVAIKVSPDVANHKSQKMAPFYALSVTVRGKQLFNS